MIAEIDINGIKKRFDLSKPIDVSMSLKASAEAASAWYVPPITIEPVKSDQFIGDVNQGGSVNFNNIAFNPHGNGTHTESVGHISTSKESINQCLKQFFFTARLITVEPEKRGEDQVITRKQIEALLQEKCEAVLIRTLPNSDAKLQRQYSNSNPPYLESDAIPYVINLGINHLLIDLPSVDREFDNGVLASHHNFWNYPDNPQRHRTITEFIYVPNAIEDGFYLLNLQIAPFENDASPSKPVLYKPID